MEETRVEMVGQVTQTEAGEVRVDGSALTEVLNTLFNPSIDRHAGRHYGRLRITIEETPFR